MDTLKKQAAIENIAFRLDSLAGDKKQLLLFTAKPEVIDENSNTTISKFDNDKKIKINLKKDSNGNYKEYYKSLKLHEGFVINIYDENCRVAAALDEFIHCESFTVALTASINNVSVTTIATFFDGTLESGVYSKESLINTAEIDRARGTTSFLINWTPEGVTKNDFKALA